MLFLPTEDTKEISLCVSEAFGGLSGERKKDLVDSEKVGLVGRESGFGGQRVREYRKAFNGDLIGTMTRINHIPHFVMREQENLCNNDYVQWIGDLKQRYRSSQAKAIVRVNAAMLEFYWSLGRDMVAMQVETKWGSGFIKQLSLDLRQEFPQQTGFSVRNLKYVRQWYLFYYERVIKDEQGNAPIGQQAVAQLEMPEDFTFVPWGHHIKIISEVQTLEEALFYIRKTIDENWSRRVLTVELTKGLYQSVGNAQTNFDKVLPIEERAQAKLLLKDPYHFDFLCLQNEYKERELEEALVHNITHFLLELGQGFAFVGRQMELRMPDGQSYFPDMIFYHIYQRRYVVVELKVVDFKPEFAGKLNFYVKAVDELLCREGDNKTIGLLICRNKDTTTVEWSFSDINKPLGVATYEIEQIVNQAILATAARKR